MSVEEGLKSTDVEVVKQARGVAKSKVAKSIKTLKLLLICDPSGTFPIDEIDAEKVEENYSKLEKNFDDFLELHERYLVFKSGAIDIDPKYADEVSDLFSNITRLHNKYKKVLNNRSKEINVSGLRDQVYALKSTLEAKGSAAKYIIDSEDVNVQKTASLTRDELRSALNNYTTKAEEYRKAILDDKEAKFTPAEDYSAATKQVEEMCVQLQSISLKYPVCESKSGSRDRSEESPGSCMVKLQKLTCPKFSGIPRDFGQFKRDFDQIVNVPGRPDVEIGKNLRDAVPEKYKHYINHLDTAKHSEMMTILENKFGTRTLVVKDITSQIEKFKVVTTDKSFVEFVEKLEKIKLDLETLNQLEEIGNAGYIGKIESKLPLCISTDWFKIVIDEKLNNASSIDRYKRLMSFLINAKDRVECQIMSMSNDGSGSGNAKSITNCVNGTVSLVSSGQKEKKERQWNPCLACNIDGATDSRSTCHPMDTCQVWASLTRRDKEKLVKCVKHPFKSNHSTAQCTVKAKKCKFCSKEDHHFLLCPSKQVKASSNVASVTSNTAYCDQSKLPVLLQAQFVQGPSGNKIGALLDLCSTDDYVTHKYAKKHKLHGEQVELSVGGIGDNTMNISTMVYMVPIMVEGKFYEFPCYGLDSISSIASPPDKDSYSDLCSQFKVKSSQVKRPASIDLLISMRQNFLHPKPLKTIDRMILYNGPLGKVFGGVNPDLVFTPFVTSYPSSVNFSSASIHSTVMKTIVKDVAYITPAKSEKAFLEYFKEESIGVECTPRCGSCRCGTCPTGAKQMSLKTEMEYDRFKSLMYLDQKGTPEDPGPYWVTRQPWIVDKTNLVNNKAAVLGVMNSTMKKLDKEPTWREVYEKQLLDLIEKKFAREVPPKELEDWVKNGGSTYYISHQVALNPSSKSTPCRVVFNSSQKFKGHSLNSSWELGPDVLNSLHGVLLRFRGDYVGGQGDVKKMYYMVRIDKEEQFMQLFLWKFPGDSEIRTFCMQRLVMGNKPSGALSIVAMRETAELGDNPKIYPAAYETITRNAYVDNVFRVAPDMETLQSDIKEVELVSAQGGFYYKDWIISHQDIPEQVIGIKLPNAVGIDEEKCLGVNWDVKNDRLFIKSNLEKPSKRPKKNHVSLIVGENPLDLLQVKPVLTIRACLSFHAKAYDPLGFVLPTRMIGNLLFRITLQRIKKERKGRIPWDEEVDVPELKEKWLEYFGMLLQIENISFPRCVKPIGALEDVLPDLITFCDGNPDSFGAVAYVVYEMAEGKKDSCLLMSKAKLGPLTQQGETSRNELCGATFASRLKDWIVKESGLKFKNHFHFVDSSIVYYMMKKSSYGFNTFAALRVGEIQSKTDVENWRHIPSQENISDVLTKGVPPNKLLPGSEWQKGPAWLSLPPSEWPISHLDDRIEYISVSDEMSKYVKKSSVSVAVGKSSVNDGELIDILIERCGNLEKLVRSFAYILRWAGRVPRQKGHVIYSKNISAAEYQDSFNFLIFWDQSRRLNIKKGDRLGTKSIQIKLTSLDLVINHIVICGRVKNFPVGFSAQENIPVLPNSAFSRLVVKQFHDKFHRDIDTTVAIVRREVWPIKLRKIASSVDSHCRICIEKRKQFMEQQMGDLPQFRSEMLPSFTVTCMDLFGPFEIKDDVVKKGPKKIKKVWGVVYTCASTRAVHLDVAIDYSTEAVLHTVRRLLALRGDVRTIVSDPGSQLVAASKELSEWRRGWDQEQLVRFGSSKNLEWMFTRANSPHQNGISEIMVKMAKGVKKTFLKVLGDTRLTLNETFTMLAEITNLINERPIGIKPCDKSGTDYLSPNSLLLGRSSSRIASGPFEADKVFTDDPKAAASRFLLVQAIVNQFWKVWLKTYFPTLLLRQKWHVDRRNVKVGDICLLKDANTFRGEWRLCEVVKVFPDKGKLIRNVQVMVKARQSGVGPYISSNPIYLDRHVCNLILLVPAEDRQECGDEGDDVG